MRRGAIPRALQRRLEHTNESCLCAPVPRTVPPGLGDLGAVPASCLICSATVCRGTSTLAASAEHRPGAPHKVTFTESVAAT